MCEAAYSVTISARSCRPPAGISRFISDPGLSRVLKYWCGCQQRQPGRPGLADTAGPSGIGGQIAVSSKPASRGAASAARLAAIITSVTMTGGPIRVAGFQAGQRYSETVSGAQCNVEHAACCISPG